MFLLGQISTISIVGIVIILLFVAIGVFKGFLRMVLSLGVLAASVAIAAAATKPLDAMFAENNYFGQEWLSSLTSGSFGFIVVFFASLIILSIVKAILLAIFGKSKSLKVVDRILGVVAGAAMGFLIFGSVLYGYVTIKAMVTGDEPASIVEQLDSFSRWMMETNLFGKIVEALTATKDALTTTK